MFDNHWRQETLNAHDREALMRQAEQDRLARHTRSTLYQPALAHIGSLLVECGARLQARYGDALPESNAIRVPAPEAP